MTSTRIRPIRHRERSVAVPDAALRWATVAGMVVITAGYAVVAPTLSPAAAQHVGQAALIGALVLGLPHGAADADTAVMRGTSTVRWLAALCLYATLAALLVGAWTQWPAATLTLLLVVAAVHFGVSDVAALHGVPARPRVPAAVALGVMPVALPLALHGASIVGVLDALSGQRAPAVIAVCRAGAAIGAVAAAFALVGAVRRRDWLSVCEPPAVIASFVVLPPLTAFAVYYASWHCVRHILPSLSDISRRHGLTLRGSASRYLLRTALPSLAVMATAILLLIYQRLPVSATAIVVVLALTAPHAVATASQHRYTRRAARTARLVG